MQAFDCKLRTAREEILMRSRIGNASRRLCCDRCGETPSETIERITGHFSQPLVKFTTMCTKCAKHIENQLKVAIEFTASHTEEDVHRYMTSGALSSAVVAIYTAFLEKHRATPTPVQKDEVGKLVDKALKCRVMHLERTKYETLCDYKLRMSETDKQVCFCCDVEIRDIDPVYCFAERWLSCVRCRNALISVPSSL